MTYPQSLVDLIADFQAIPDKRERLEMVFELASEVNELAQEEWSDLTRVRGCQSEAHVKVTLENGRVNFQSAADAKLVQGLMGILTIALEGMSAVDALTLDPNFAEEMGLLNTLTPSRSNGFRNMFDKVMSEIRQQME